MRAEVEQELSCGDEEDRVAFEHGLVREILGDHRLSQALRGGEHDVAPLGEVVAAESAVDELAVDLRRPRPIEVGHRLEATEVAVREATVQTAPDAVLLVDVHDALQELRRTPALLRGLGDEVVEPFAGGAETEITKPLRQITHGDPPGRRCRACRSGQVDVA